MPDPLEYFALHGLAVGSLSRSKSGINNAVWLSDAYVLRVSNHDDADHTREAELALHALNLGIRTARPLHWTQRYSI